MRFQRPAFIQVTKKSIIAKLKQQEVRNKYHTAIAIDVKAQIDKLVQEAILIAISKLEQMKEKVYKENSKPLTEVKDA